MSKVVGIYTQVHLSQKIPSFQNSVKYYCTNLFMIPVA